MGREGRDLPGDAGYLEGSGAQRSPGFDSKLLQEPLSALPKRQPIVLSPTDSVTEAMRAMQRQHSGCVVVTNDGTSSGEVTGIFTERDVLFGIVDRGRNPAVLPLREVMTTDPECLRTDSTLAEVLNLMSITGFRHLPVVDDRGRPLFVVSVRDVVTILVELFPREVLNLPPKHFSRSRRTREGA
jgi:CBS domain-containing protein